MIAPESYILRNCALLHNDFEIVRHVFKHFYLESDSFPLKLVKDGVDVSNYEIDNADLKLYKRVV